MAFQRKLALQQKQKRENDRSGKGRKRRKNNVWRMRWDYFNFKIVIYRTELKKKFAIFLSIIHSDFISNNSPDIHSFTSSANYSLFQKPNSFSLFPGILIPERLLKVPPYTCTIIEYCIIY